jgi:hypothetical protein
MLRCYTCSARCARQTLASFITHTQCTGCYLGVLVQTILLATCRRADLYRPFNVCSYSSPTPKTPPYSSSLAYDSLPTSCRKQQIDITCVQTSAYNTTEPQMITRSLCRLLEPVRTLLLFVWLIGRPLEHQPCQEDCGYGEGTHIPFSSRSFTLFSCRVSLFELE